MSFRETLQTLSSANDFFAALDVPFDEKVVQVNRLHIMKRMNQYLAAEKDIDALDDAALKALYTTLLEKSYQDFLTSTPAQEKVFKVFQDQAEKEGARFVSLDSLKKVR